MSEEVKKYDGPIYDGIELEDEEELYEESFIELSDNEGGEEDE